MAGNEEHLESLLEGDDDELEEGAEEGAEASVQAGDAEGAEEGAKAKGKEGDDKDDDGKVPRSALIAERKRLREQMDEQNRRLQQAEQANQRYQYLEHQIAEMRRQRQADEQGKDQPPDYDDDPQGYIQWHLEKQREYNQQIEGKLTQQQQMEQQQATLAQIQEQAAASQRAFAQEHPDFNDALNHTREMNRRVLSRYGYQGPQLEQAIAQSELATIASALQNGVDPATMIYQIAQDMGYNPDQKGQEGQQREGQEGDDIEAQQAREAAKSMGGGGGDESIADMDDDEFTEVFQELFGKKPDAQYTDV